MHDLPAVDYTQLCHLPPTPTPKAAFNKITGPCTEIKFHDQVHLETCSLYIHIVHASVMEEPSLNFQAKLQSNFELFQTSITSNLHAIPSLSQPKHTRANSKRMTEMSSAVLVAMTKRMKLPVAWQQRMTEMSSAVLVAMTKRMKLPVAWQQIYKTNFVWI